LWFADVPNRRCVRVREGGQVLDVIDVDRGCFACMLGDPDRRTLFVLAAEWSGPDEMDGPATQPTGRILAVAVEVPGVGWP
jgi:sugar lactone lactonase YvrE